MIVPDEDLGPQEDIIEKVNEYLVKIDNAKMKHEKDLFIMELLHYLISSSKTIAEEGDLYEAGGRLYSAGYYLEETYPETALDLYKAAVEHYEKYLSEKMREGAVSEASNIALKIANVLHDKIHDVEKEKQYVEKAIELVRNQISILEGMGPSRELSAKYQMLSALFSRNAQWAEVLDTARNAIELAKVIKEYTIIANAYNDTAYALEQLKEPKKGQNVLFEAMDYFSKEAAAFEQTQELLPLSQIYQIIKNIYGVLRDPKRFQIFSRKEAGVYIALAKLGLINNTSNSQIASYYRGAALCYRETNQNDLDAASCFVLAGDYYMEAKKYVEASINLQDAAIVFEQLRNYRKAHELYCSAGENAVKAKNLEIAIENFMQAYSMAEKEHLDTRKIANLLIKYLEQLAKIEEIGNNHFVAATLYLELAIYLNKFPKAERDNIKSYLEKSNEEYYIAAKSAFDTGQRSSVAYTYALCATTAKYLQLTDRYKETHQKLTKIETKVAQTYSELVNNISTWIENQKEPLQLNEKLQKTLISSDEMAKMVELFRNI